MPASAWRVPFVLDLQHCLFADLCAGHSDSRQAVQGVVLMVLPLEFEGSGAAFNVPCLFLVNS